MKASLAVVLALIGCSHAFKLSSDGGYDIVIGVDNSQNISTSEQLRYVQNLKQSMQTFSNQLWRTTHRRFYVKSVEVILPETWDLVDSGVAEIGGTHTSDFRISDSVTYPHAKNPNLCGLPGEYVELPYSFFQNANSNEFGPVWKTLLFLFARYRYGVYEEHGFIGDQHFPYFVQNSFTATWGVTGCNNEPLVGKYVNVTDQDQLDCTVEWSTSEEDLNHCRFIPDRVNNRATTSLMHFHWMDSVTEFCDNHNHNSVAENKQNTFCDQTSVMQVIRESPDYAIATNPRTDVPALNFKTAVQSPNPLFYILLDYGLIQGSYHLANLIPPALARMLNGPTLQNVVASVGSFPNPDSTASHVKTEVGWSQIGANKENFLTAIGNLYTNGPVMRDFSRALYEVVGTIKERGHPNGAVILVVKYGTDLENLNKTLPESDVLIALNEQKIIVHSIELPVTGETPRAHVGQIASATTGGFFTLTSSIGAEAGLNTALGYVGRTVGDPVYAGTLPTMITVARKSISNGANDNGIQLPIPQGTTQAEVLFNSVDKLVRANFEALVDNVIVTPSFRRTVDWNEMEGKTSYSYSLRFSALAGKTSVLVKLNCTAAISCSGQMVGRIPYVETAGGGNRVDIEITASSHELDLSRQVPLSIYAKATISGLPIAGLQATAILSRRGSNESHILDLHDDGTIPDILEKDGIYSAYFVPSANGDGEYSVSVRFANETVKLTEDATEFTIRESSLGRLLPIDQGPGGHCEVFNNCTFETVEGGFSQVADLALPVVISNSNLFVARPSKAILLYNKIMHSLHWFSPRIPGFSTTTPATRYEIRSSPNRQQLIDNFETCDLVRDEANQVSPGRPIAAMLPNTDETTFYAVRSQFNGAFGPVSNVVAKYSLQPPETTTTEPTTTTTTTTTTPGSPTTTTPPTPTPEDSTTTTDVTTTTSNDPGTTTTTSITTPPTPTTTVNPSTTSAPPGGGNDGQSWAESPAGIGVIVGIVLVVLLVGGVALFLRRRKTGSRRISG